jgi:hypothetical protein
LTTGFGKDATDGDAGTVEGGLSCDSVDDLERDLIDGVLLVDLEGVTGPDARSGAVGESLKLFSWPCTTGVDGEVASCGCCESLCLCWASFCCCCRGIGAKTKSWCNTRSSKTRSDRHSPGCSA